MFLPLDLPQQSPLCRSGMVFLALLRRACQHVLKSWCSFPFCQQNPKIVRQLIVEGWGIYWVPARSSGNTKHRQDHRKSRSSMHSSGVQIQPSDYIVPPMTSVIQVLVRDRPAAGSLAVPGASATDAGAGSSGQVRIAVEVLIGAEAVSLQLSQQQMVGMARFADDAAVWLKRNEHGMHRPAGWATVLQAHASGAAAGGRAQHHHQQQQHPQTGFEQPQGGQSAVELGAESNEDQQGAGEMVGDVEERQLGKLQQEQQQERGFAGTLANGVSRWLWSPRIGLTPPRQSSNASSSRRISSGVESSNSSSHSEEDAGSRGLSPSAACGAGGTVTWKQVWQYAIRATLAQLRRQKRKVGGGQLTKIQQQERRCVCMGNGAVMYCCALGVRAADPQLFA